MAAKGTKTFGIDDVRLSHVCSDIGYPILFTNQEIRRMLRLADAREEEVLFDLGSGWGQNLIIAATEFGVRTCVGVERLKPRYRKSLERIRNLSLSNQISVYHAQFEDLVDGLITGVSLGSATIVIYALETDEELTKQLSSQLKPGCRLLYYYNALFPEIMPDGSDYPFFVSRQPFTRSESEQGWLTSIIRKPHSSAGGPPCETELWEELYHDYDVMGLGRAQVRGYRTRLLKAIRGNSEWVKAKAQ